MNPLNLLFMLCLALVLVAILKKIYVKFISVGDSSYIKDLLSKEEQEQKELNKIAEKKIKKNKKLKETIEKQVDNSL